MVVALVAQAHAQHLALERLDRLDLGERGRVAAEAVDALPGRPAQARHEALALDRAVREQVEVARREEVRLALEARADRARLEPERARRGGVRGLLPRPRGRQVREHEAPAEPEAGVRRIHEPWVRRVRRDHVHVQPQVQQAIAQRVPLPDGERAVDRLAASPAVARVRVRAAHDREVGGVAHEHHVPHCGGHGNPSHGVGGAGVSHSSDATGKVQYSVEVTPAGRSLPLFPQPPNGRLDAAPTVPVFQLRSPVRSSRYTRSRRSRLAVKTLAASP